MSIVYLASVCPICKKVNALPFTKEHLAALLLNDAQAIFHNECHNVGSHPSIEVQRAMIKATLAPLASTTL